MGIKVKDGYSTSWFECDNCGRGVLMPKKEEDKYDRCPYCGEKLEFEEDKSNK